MKKVFLRFLAPLTITLALLSCSTGADNKNEDYNEWPLPEELLMYEEEMNPEYTSRTQALNAIFNPDELGQMVLVFDRSEWDAHLKYCDLNLDHEEMVKAKGFYFAKDNNKWFFKDIGFRIRGNTSRVRPQDFNGKYVPAHFALDFEEWIEDNSDKKLANSMKGLILKRFKDDPTYCREVYAYNMFRQSGIWIAPRAAYTQLIIQIQEEDGSFETINFGVYAMIEEIKKQFLKERTEELSEIGGGKLEDNKGHLWKLSWPADFKNLDDNGIGEESSNKVKDSNGKLIGIDVKSFPYDYKGDKTLEEGKTLLKQFVAELNNLPDCTDGNNDEADIATIKEFYTNKMDGDLFLRTYAVNVILGMWDDYWMNSNNFYFYFDESGKAYFIPFDYDNILGVNGLNTDIAKHSPIAWGNLDDGNRPLIQKILQVPEYMQAYKVYLDEFSNEESYFDDDKSIERIKKWQEMIKPYIYGRKLNYTFEQKNKYFCKVYKEIADFPADWGSPYKKYTLYTPGDMNYFTVRQNTIKQHLGKSDTLILTLDAGKGYFYQSQSNYQIKSYTYTFKKGDTLKKILNANNFQNWTVFYSDNDKSFLFGYEENGIFYYPDWFCDEEGNWVDEYQTFTTSTVLGSIYRRFYNVTFDLNGGTI